MTTSIALRGEEGSAPTEEVREGQASEALGGRATPATGQSEVRIGEVGGGLSERAGAVPPPLDELLEELAAFIRQYVVLGEHLLTAVALWTLHTHVFEAFDTTPYLAVTSPEKQCGKTRLIEVLRFVVRRGWQTSNPSVAAFYRKIEQETPTLLLDETDAIWSGREESYQELRGALNSGYRRGGSVARCVGVGASQVVHNFATFCPKLLAGIGKMPDTVADRAIPLRLERKRRSEPTKPFRFRDVRDEVVPLRARIDDWAASIDLDELRGARPATIEGISDRAQDCWEPLFAIAELAGEPWTTKAHWAAGVLSGEREDDSRAVQLLRDIRDVFGSESQLATATLLGRLTADRSKPWSVWLDHQGKIETGAPRKLAGLLEEFSISPRTIRTKTPGAGGQTKDGTVKGYRREDFADAWERYL